MTQAVRRRSSKNSPENISENAHYFKWMVDQTQYFHEAEIHESMAVTGTDLVKGKY